jgi:murein L,D-transpeptidase YcbB/YkuD
MFKKFLFFLKLEKLSLIGSFFGLILFLNSCNTPEKVDEKSLSKEEKMEMVYSDIKIILTGKLGSFDYEGEKVFTTPFLSDFYSTNSSKWYDGNGVSKNAKLILDFLSQAHYYGLDTNFYHTNFIRETLKNIESEEDFVIKSKQLAIVDVLITDGVFLFATHVSNGFLDAEKMEVIWKKDSLKIDLVKLLKENMGEKLIHSILDLQPHYFEYKDLIVSLKNFLDSNKVLSEEKMEFASIKKDSATCGKQVRERLIHLKYLSEKDKDIDSMGVKALTKYQEDHSLDNDGKIGSNTLQSLSESEMDKFRRACLALEKWRWKRRDKEFQFRLNIPEYELTIIRNDSIIHRTRAVTGTVVTQTPELKAKMKWITLHPYWHLPHSISSTEFLYSAQRDTAYIKKADYQVFKGSEPVNTKDVNWKKLSKNNFPYRIRQNGGSGNSLGLIVFHFPNKHDVYMHDTPAKYLFKRSTRAFSHGCMRLNEPFSVGEIVMKNEKPKDTITADTLKKWSLRGFEQRINLKKQVPVEVDYISVSGDSTGKIIFHLDIYRRDEKFLPFIFPRKGQVPVKEKEAVIARIEFGQLSGGWTYWSV